MKKIFAILVFIFLAVVLVACGGGAPRVEYLVASPDKITFDKENINETFEEGHPKIDANNIAVYAVMSNGAVEEISEKTITSALIGDGKYEVTVTTGQNQTVKYNVYTYDSTSTGDEVVVAAIKFTTDDIEEIASSLVTILANDYVTEHLNLLLAKSDGTQIEEPAIFDNSNFDMYKHTVQTISLSSESSNTISIDYKVKVVKPVDNEIPIRTEYANFWDWVFIIPVAFVMQFFAGIFFNSFAMGILMATIIVRTLAWPIYAKSNDLSLRMSIAQPEMTRIQEKYANRQDPVSKQKMQLELMQVYKKHKISILGCFTPLLQMPIFLAMYQVVHRITQPGGLYNNQVSNTNFLWMDLSVGSELTSSLILAILVGFTMYLLQRVSSKRPDHLKKTGTQNVTDQQAQQQKTMKIVSIVMIGFMTLASFSYNALAFYWLIGNLYSLGQTLINRRLSAKRYEKMKNQL